MSFSTKHQRQNPPNKVKTSVRRYPLKALAQMSAMARHQLLNRVCWGSRCDIMYGESYGCRSKPYTSKLHVRLAPGGVDSNSSGDTVVYTGKEF